MADNKKVAIIGSGLIGRSWAMIFSSYGYRVQMHDVKPESMAEALRIIRKELTELCENNLAKGSLSLDQRIAAISTTESLEECIQDAYHIQECVFEDLALKQHVFGQVDKLLGDNQEAAICSSTSVNLPSLVFSKVEKHAGQCLVAHPINPPMFVRLVELVPTSKTREDILIRTRLLMDEIGQKPVILNKEIPGFALNRLQYAVFQIAFQLVHDGIMTPEDVDTVISDGLGPRYAFMGPWLTAHLNASGMGDYLERYNEGIYNITKDCQNMLRIEGEAAQQIVDAMIREVPLDKLQEKRAWRDKCLRELASLKDKIGLH